MATRTKPPPWVAIWARVGKGRDMATYLHDWAEGGEAEMLSDFGIGPEALAGAKVLVASYTYEDYTGDAYFLFERGGKLWEVHGSHCSCYGLSQQDYEYTPGTQWEPEETTAEAILARINRGTWGQETDITVAVRAALGNAVSQHP